MVVPLDWLLSGIAAACFHELCHILAVFCLGGSIRSVRICGRGAIMDAEPMEPWGELVCILAGPAGSFALLAVSGWFPKTALCGIVQGVFNLLPVYPLDGGRVLSCVMGMLFTPDTARRICTAVRHLVAFFLVSIGLYGIFAYDLGFFPVFVLLVLLYRAGFGKIPCNAGKLGVQ